LVLNSSAGFAAKTGIPITRQKIMVEIFIAAIVSCRPEYGQFTIHD